MNNYIRRIHIVLQSLVFLVGGSMTIHQQLQYKKSHDIYNEARDLASPSSSELESEPPAETGSEPQSEPASAGSFDAAPSLDPPADPRAQAMNDMDLGSLQRTNEDVLGWIEIPDTDLSYPLVQGTDNQFYLDHTWKKEPNSAGSIFLECQCSPDLSDFNTIIYGHRMRNGSMFGSLKYFNDPAYWNEHPVIYLRDSSGTRQYTIFAAYEAGIRSFTYRLKLTEARDKQTLIDFALSSSVIDTGVIPTVDDRILTLSTCTGNGHASRWVVQAVLTSHFPSDS